MCFASGSGRRSCGLDMQWTYEKLPAKVKATLALPKAEYKKALEAGRKKKAEWEAKELDSKGEEGGEEGGLGGRR